ncbi:MAG TPA: polyphenol oxidase family protein [Candidatus Binatia bacterium]|nr:polyphenol oxidase family protein [Candidatus Binatia bacterium]
MPLRAIGLRVGGVEHGFGTRDEPVPDEYRVVRARQVHGAALVWPNDATPSPAGDADALLTDRPGLAVAVATADCVPVLIAAPGARVVAAVHAGWRGTLAGIVPTVVDELRSRRGVPATELRVALGPSIDGCCFEIEREIAARFADRFGDEMWSAWRDGRPRDDVPRGTLDLRAVNRRLLLAAGVPDAAIEFVGPCTFCGDAGFASYRRDGATAGRQLSWIALQPAP